MKKEVKILYVIVCFLFSVPALSQSIGADRAADRARERFDRPDKPQHETPRQERPSVDKPDRQPAMGAAPKVAEVIIKETVKRATGAAISKKTSRMVTTEEELAEIEKYRREHPSPSPSPSPHIYRDRTGTPADRH